ncbi:hypothetical protein [Haloarcula sebkhae]|uniref:Uncharacterized protein n=2 Tax=Haloarcula sebkhae TaxID=932660 RepID=A0ACC6VJV2_9EURY|nr:hypothetical protein [Haloarcula sebkhae]
MRSVPLAFHFQLSWISRCLDITIAPPPPMLTRLAAGGAYRTTLIAIAPPPPTLTRLAAGGAYRTTDIAIAPPPPTLIPTMPR